MSMPLPDSVAIHADPASTRGLWSVPPRPSLRRVGAPVGAPEADGIGSETVTLERLRRREPDALATLYGDHRDAVFRFVRKRVGSDAEAEDLTQDTFLQALRSIDRFEGRSSLRTWLLGIARNVCLRFYRFGDRWMIGPFGADEEIEPAFDARIEDRLDAARALRRCDDALARHRGDENRSIFHLRYAEGAAIRGIADEVGKSRDAVKASLRRSRLAIERAVPQHEELRA